MPCGTEAMSRAQVFGSCRARGQRICLGTTGDRRRRDVTGRTARAKPEKRSPAQQCRAGLGKTGGAASQPGPLRPGHGVMALSAGTTTRRSFSRSTVPLSR